MIELNCNQIYQDFSNHYLYVIRKILYLSYYQPISQHMYIGIANIHSFIIKMHYVSLNKHVYCIIPYKSIFIQPWCVNIKFFLERKLDLTWQQYAILQFRAHIPNKILNIENELIAHQGVNRRNILIIKIFCVRSQNIICRKLSSKKM